MNQPIYLPRRQYAKNLQFRLPHLRLIPFLFQLLQFRPLDLPANSLG